MKLDSKPSLIPVTWQIKYRPLSPFNMLESNVMVDPVAICLPFTGTVGVDEEEVNQVIRSLSTGVRQFHPSHLALMPLLMVEL